MEVVYKEKKKKPSHFIFYFPTHNKFLVPLMLTPLEKNFGAATAHNVFVLKFVRWVMGAARNFQESKTIIKKLKDLRQMIYPYSSNWVLLGIWWLVFVFTKQ